MVTYFTSSTSNDNSNNESQPRQMPNESIRQTRNLQGLNGRNVELPTNPLMSNQRERFIQGIGRNRPTYPPANDVRTNGTPPTLPSRPLPQQPVIATHTPRYVFDRYGPSGMQASTRAMAQERGLEGPNVRRLRLPLISSRIQVYSLDLLFYLFYNFNDDSVQMMVTYELYCRGWKYHKIFHQWLVPVHGRRGLRVRVSPDRTYLDGEFYAFERVTWRILRQPMRVYYRDLEFMTQRPVNFEN